MPSHKETRDNNTQEERKTYKKGTIHMERIKVTGVCLLVNKAFTVATWLRFGSLKKRRGNNFWSSVHIYQWQKIQKLCSSSQESKYWDRKREKVIVRAGSNSSNKNDNLYRNIASY